MIYKPHGYQELADQHIVDHKANALFLDLGLGKTIITLTALEKLINSIQINKALIVAPKRVAEHTWRTELNKWDHLRGLSMSIIAGEQKKRIAGLLTPADIYVVSCDNIAWLVDYCSRILKKWPFDMLVLDELSKFKNRQSMRFKAIRKVLPRTQRITGLTGTPVPNGLLDLWAQIYLLDSGERLGRTFTGYKDQYFTPGARSGHIVFKYELKEGADKLIHNKVSDICLSMTAKDYLDLPPRIDITEEVELANYDAYAEFKKSEILKLENGDELSPVNAAAMYNKLLQFANGAVYDEAKQWHVVDNSKMEALLEAVEELNGKPVLIFYQFISDYERISKELPHAVKLQGGEDIDSWNRKEIQVLLAHPASAGHGLNLQDGGHHIFWFGVPWDLELYLQAVGRLDRQGQAETVINKRFIGKGTVEEIVLSRLGSKGLTQDELINALKRHLY